MLAKLHGVCNHAALTPRNIRVTSRLRFPVNSSSRPLVSTSTPPVRMKRWRCRRRNKPSILKRQHPLLYQRSMIAVRTKGARLKQFKYVFNPTEQTTDIHGRLHTRVSLPTWMSPRQDPCLWTLHAGTTLPWVRAHPLSGVYRWLWTLPLWTTVWTLW